MVRSLKNNYFLVRTKLRLICIFFYRSYNFFVFSNHCCRVFAFLHFISFLIKIFVFMFFSIKEAVFEIFFNSSLRFRVFFSGTLSYFCFTKTQLLHVSCLYYYRVEKALKLKSSNEKSNHLRVFDKEGCS